MVITIALSNHDDAASQCQWHSSSFYGKIVKETTRRQGEWFIGVSRQQTIETRQSIIAAAGRIRSSVTID
jgi:hypothetical protein